MIPSGNISAQKYGKEAKDIYVFNKYQLQYRRWKQGKICACCSYHILSFKELHILSTYGTIYG